MEFGCHLPVFGPVATRAGLLTFAREMERLGYESLWASDHVVIPHTIESRYPYSADGRFPLQPDASFLEPLTALGLVAGVTERARLGTTVLVLPHRHPVLAAKMLATLDHLSGGRVILGAGVGWMREEIELLGAPFDQRGAWSRHGVSVTRKRTILTPDQSSPSLPPRAIFSPAPHLSRACSIKFTDWRIP